MSASAARAPSTSTYTTPAFWEGLWRTAGIQSVVLFVIAYAIYDGHRTSTLIAAVAAGFAVLNLLWFAAAIRTTLADAGQDGWGAAATAASAVVGAMALLVVTMAAAVAHSTGGSANGALAAALNDFTPASVVLSSFPRAMLIMAGTFGLWRAGLISNTVFGVGVGAVILVLAGGTTWADEGFWSPAGSYSRIISPAIGVLWVLAASRVLLSRAPAARAGW